MCGGDEYTIDVNSSSGRNSRRLEVRGKFSL
jgi:hypothetical protein